MSEPRRDIYVLLDALCEGRETNAQRAELWNRMRVDPEARRVYADYMATHAELGWRMRDENAERRTRNAEVARSIASPSRLRFGSVVAIAAALLVAVGLAAYVFVFSDPRSEIRDTQPQGPPLAVLLDAVDVRWSTDRVTTGSDLHRDTYAIASGTIEASLRGGATVRLTGPASMRLIDGNRVRLLRGKLHARQDGGGLVVQLPGEVTVTDLGTAFDIEVNDDGAAHVSVTEGVVHIDRPASETTAAFAFDLEAGWRCDLPTDGASGAIELVRDLRIANHSFEADGVNRAGGPMPKGWHTTIHARTGAEDHVSTGNFTAGVDGRFVGLANYPIGSDPEGVEAALYQDLDHRTEAGVRYRLTVATGRRINVGKTHGQGRWRFALVDADTGEALAVADGVTEAHGVMVDHALEYTPTEADADRRLRVVLTNPAEPVPGGQPHQINYDNVRLEAFKTVATEPLDETEPDSPKETQP